MSLLQKETQLRAWMLGGLDGDPRGHHELFRAVRPILTGFFARRVGAGAADDLVQEVLIAVHEHRHSYDRDRPFIPWLFAIARHKLIDHFRRYRRHEPLEGLEAALRDEGFEAVSAARMDVAALLATLNAKQSRAIRDTWLRGLSVAEAARRAGIGESDVKVSAHRGLRALQARCAGLAA